MTVLEIEVLRSGTRIVRPVGAVGTCGWWPKAWTLAVLRRTDTPKAAFLRANPNWSAGEVANA
jgi:hypothetical protein